MSGEDLVAVEAAFCRLVMRKEKEQLLCGVAKQQVSDQHEGPSAGEFNTRHGSGPAVEINPNVKRAPERVLHA